MTDFVYVKPLENIQPFFINTDRISSFNDNDTEAYPTCVEVRTVTGDSFHIAGRAAEFADELLRVKDYVTA